MNSVDSDVHEYESLIQGFIDKEYGINDDFLPPDIVDTLRIRLLDLYAKGEMHPAGVGRQSGFQKNKIIRGDLIHWIEPDTSDLSEQYFLKKVQDFMTYLNKTCYTSLNAFEFHYAFYEQGSFYIRHKDRFDTDAGRKFSLVCYLNDHWQSEDEGQLVLYLPDHAEVILPLGGRAAFFKSDETEHEVKMSPTRYRLSITGWLKSV